MWRYRALVFEGMILGAIYLWPTLQTGLKAFINQIVVGRSSIKVYLFVLIVMVLRRLYHSNMVVRSRPWLLHVALLIVLFALGAGEFLYLNGHLFDTRAHMLEARIRVFLPPDALSISRLTHIHNSKMVMSVLSALFSPLAMDAGLPFARFYPTWLGMIHLLLLVVLILVSGHLLVGLKDEMRLDVFMVFGIAVFVLLKNAIDGGFFSHEVFLFALPLYVFVALAYWRDGACGLRRLRYVSSRFVYLYVGIAGLYALLIFALLNKEMGFSLVGLRAFSLLLVLLVGSASQMAGSLWLRDIRAARIAARAVVVVMVAVGCMLVLNRVVDRKFLLDFHVIPNSVVPAGSVVSAYAPSAQRLDELRRLVLEEPVSYHSAGEYVSIRGAVARDANYYEMCRILGVNPNLEPIVVVDESCLAGGAIMVSRIGYVHPCEIGGAGSRRLDIQFSGDDIVLRGDTYCFVQIDSERPACSPVPLTLFLSELQQAGITTFIELAKVEPRAE